jgi:YD repeat-containing protein
MVDERGNVAGANPADFTTHYAYDAARELTSVTDPLAGSRHMPTTSTAAGSA